MLAQQCSEIICPLLGPFPWTTYKMKKTPGIYLPSCLPLPFLSPPPSQCLVHGVGSWQADRCTAASEEGQAPGTHNIATGCLDTGSAGEQTPILAYQQQRVSGLAHSPPMCIISLQDLSATSVFRQYNQAISDVLAAHLKWCQQILPINA